MTPDGVAAAAAETAGAAVAAAAAETAGGAAVGADAVAALASGAATAAGTANSTVGMAKTLPTAAGRLRGKAAALAKKLSGVYEVHSWNPFRYIGDGLHLFGVLALLLTILKNKSVKGLSRSTQILYLFVFVCRYLDLVDHSQTAYLVVFKLVYILTSITALFAFFKLDRTYEAQKDTCSLAVIFIPCTLGAMLLTDEYSALDLLWTFSQFLEGFAMVPQYIFCYRDPQARDWGVTAFVLSLGSYRVFYAANWIYKVLHLPNYRDVQSWTGGIIEISFFVDFLLSLITGRSLLRSWVLKVDEKINEIQDKVEQKVLGHARQKPVGTAAASGGELRQRRAPKAADNEVMEV